VYDQRIGPDWPPFVCVCVCVQFVPMFSSTNKSSRSAVLFVSEGQYVGSPVDRYEQLCFVMDCSKFLPFGVINLDPQLVCFAFQSPPTMNLFPRW